MTNRVRRPDTWDLGFLLGAGAAGAMLIVLGAGMTFYSDEWAFIEGRALGDPIGWLRPHNEHWSTLPIIVYRSVVEAVGIATYLPFHALVVLLHLAVAAMTWRLVRRWIGPPPALAAALLVLLFGSGFENLYWAFQIGFVGSVLLGLIAVDVCDGPATRRRAWIVILLLVLNLMTSAIGLLFWIAVAVRWGLELRWRTSLPLLVIPAIIGAGWYVAFGHAGRAIYRDPLTLDALADVPQFIVLGLGSAARALSALPIALALLGIVGILTVAGWLARRSRLPAVVPALIAAIATQYALIGLSRGGFGTGPTEISRYTYVSGILLLIVVASLAGALREEFPRRARRAGILVATSVYALALTFNVALLLAGREMFLANADLTRALVTVALARPLPASTDPDHSLYLVPAPSALERIAAAYGDPRGDSLLGAAVRPIPAEVMEQAERWVRTGVPYPDMSEAASPLPLTARATPLMRADEGCPADDHAAAGGRRGQ